MLSKDELQTKAINLLDKYKSGMDSLSLARANANKEYMSAKYGNEVKGRSQVVTSDIADTIEWIMPDLMRIFYGTKNVTTFKPRGADDEDKAKLLEGKVNFDLQVRNKGFLLLYTFFKDALLYKLGVIKWYWEKKTKYKKRKYEGVTRNELLALQMNQNNIIDNIKERGNDIFDVSIRQIKQISSPVIINLPPEEFIFDINARSLFDSEMVGHRKLVHKNYVKSKYKVSENEISYEKEFISDHTEKDARFKDLGGINYFFDNQDEDKLYLYELDIKDYDDDGDVVYRKVTMMGTKVINEIENEYSRPNYSVLTPIIMTHRLLGRSVVDLVTDLQKLMTSLSRYIMDNIYFQNNGVNVVNPYRINMVDLQEGQKPGGNVRTKHDVDPKTAIFPLPVRPLPSWTLQVVEFVQTMKENRTGITRYNQGLDANSLNKTATGISQIMSASMQRKELIARIFAETGVKDLIECVAKLNVEYFDSEESLKLDDKWQIITPEDVDVEFDVEIDVGVGTGTKDMVVQQMNMMLQTYAMIAKIAGEGAIEVFTLENVKNILIAIWENLGYKNTGSYVNMNPPQGVPIGPGTGVNPIDSEGAGISGVIEQLINSGVLPGNGAGNIPAVGNESA